MTEERRRPCDPALCPDHKAHQQALEIGDERFSKIEAKLDILLNWKAEMKGVWFIGAIILGVLSSLVPTLINRVMPPVPAHATQIERTMDAAK